jgi:hypothetical protein
VEPISAILTFLGGSTFRMVWGEMSHWLTAAREHKREMERMRLEGQLAAEQHARNLEAQRLQAELGVQVIRVQAEATLDKLEGEGWLEAVKATGRTVGIAWVDAWNAVIRPALATWSVLMLTAHEFKWVGGLSDTTITVCLAILGIYVADRSLAKRGK